MENQEEKELNNTYQQSVDVYITLDNGTEYRVFKKADPVQMENQEEKETSIEYFYERVLESINYSSDEYYAITEALNEAKKMYAEEIDKAKKIAFTEGYHSAIKYNHQIENLK